MRRVVRTYLELLLLYREKKSPLSRVEEGRGSDQAWFEECWTSSKEVPRSPLGRASWCYGWITSHLPYPSLDRRKAAASGNKTMRRTNRIWRNALREDDVSLSLGYIFLKHDSTVLTQIRNSRALRRLIIIINSNSPLDTLMTGMVSTAQTRSSSKLHEINFSSSKNGS
ncbi:hypothetical protein RRG08_049044 [Elysia crispata]|uniref:Uncharacterized protein n=1 Tax=Elysia crispata TaxID=231223 RepID=A0AAE1D3E5_9GAST|nr:hypothetical protein RRG08_049044 [Elysia crispata]